MLLADTAVKVLQLRFFGKLSFEIWIMDELLVCAALSTILLF